MFYDSNSLKLYDTEAVSKSCTAEFKLFVLIERYINTMQELKMPEPLYLSGDSWFIHITTSKVTVPSSFQIFMEIKHSDPSKAYDGSWTVILSAIDRKHDAKLHCSSLQQLMRFSILDLKLYLTDVHSILKFEVQVVVRRVDLELASHHSILTDLQRNYENIAESSDVTILARGGETVAVHKTILMLRSPVFKAMFDSNMAESNSKQVHMPDFDHGTIRRMVEFLYKDSFTDIESTSLDDFISLLSISDKYLVLSLKDASSRYLSKMITVDNIADMRHSAILYDSKTLLTACLHFIQSNAHQLFKDDSFLSKCIEIRQL